jgi:hypothetical protein
MSVKWLFVQRESSHLGSAVNDWPLVAVYGYNFRLFDPAGHVVLRPEKRNHNVF